MRYLISHIVRSVLLVATFGMMAVSCNEPPREEILKVYNWADYIDEDLLEEFEVWYEEQTGCKVKVVYQTFDINEVMLAKIEKGEADFDVVCPSEYIIERMMRNDLLQPIVTPEFEREINDKNINYIRCVSPYIKRQFSLLQAPEGKEPNDYSVGYMWGTTGILYNTKYVTEEEAMSWDLMFDERLKDKIFVKDAFRDVYSPMLIYVKTLEAREAGIIGDDQTLPLNDSVRMERGLMGKVSTIEELMFDSSDESIALVESHLKRIKRLVAGWEADFGKEMMTQEKAWINLMWSGDAVWAIDEAPEDVSLDYVVPKEGSVVWFDGWVIPKYAKNTRAARYFINFMCKPENVIRNMDASGYISVIGTQETLEAMELLTPVLAELEECDDAQRRVELEAERDAILEAGAADLSYFFQDERGEPLLFENEAGYMIHADSVYVDPIMYPDKSVIERCAMMHDSGEQTEKMLEMWSRVKGDNLSPVMLWGIILFFAVLIIWGVWRKVAKHRKHEKMLKRRRHGEKRNKETVNH